MDPPRNRHRVFIEVSRSPVRKRPNHLNRSCDSPEFIIPIMSHSRPPQYNGENCDTAGRLPERNLGTRAPEITTRPAAHQILVLGAGCCGLASSLGLMAQQNESRTHGGRLPFVNCADGVGHERNFGYEEIEMMETVDSARRFNKQEPFQLGLKTLRNNLLESSPRTIDNVKSKIHSTLHDSTDAWCFGIMSIFAFAMMILVGCPTSIDGCSHIGTIVRLVLVLGSQPLWTQQLWGQGASIQAQRDLEGTRKQRAAGGILNGNQRPIHQSSSRRVLSSQMSQ
ncbi:hypothetical protein V8F20_009811 [Naviculisporaceae sp. PSN 640]